MTKIGVALLLCVGCGHAAPPPLHVAPAPDAVEESTPPAPESNSEMPCAWFPEGTAIYRVGERDQEEGYTAFDLIRGQTCANPEIVEIRDDLLMVLEDRDINGDGLTDYAGTPGPDPWCSGYDGCVSGVYVACGEGVAELMPPSVPQPRVTQTYKELGGFRWFDLMTCERGASWTEELEDEGEGVVGVSCTLLRMGDDRRYHTVRGADVEMSALCLEHRREGRRSLARAACSNAIPLARQRDQRGAMTYQLAGVARAEGNIAEARELYERAIEDRPEDAEIRSRLDALPQPQEPE